MTPTPPVRLTRAAARRVGTRRPFLQASNGLAGGDHGVVLIPENPAVPVPDDLLENAIWVEDGGDGIINGNDYILFYAPGPHPWIKDSVNKDFRHQKNLYSEQSYYYLTIGGGTGKRVNPVNPALSPNQTITSFNERYFYELDTFNFLSIPFLC